MLSLILTGSYVRIKLSSIFAVDMCLPSIKCDVFRLRGTVVGDSEWLDEWQFRSFRAG